MDRDMYVLEADIRKKLKQFELDVKFRAEKGCLGILGPSGCGKSMTLKSIAGIVRPDSGKILLQTPAGQPHVLFDQEKKIDERPQQRRVGYLFQNYALFPNMTVEQNIASGLKGRGWRKRKDSAGGRFGEEERGGGQDRREGEKDRVQEMIRRFRLEGLEKRYPSRLSSGQQQRVALARILAYEPEVLLLDEPFSAMDAFLREKLRLELAQVLKGYQKISVLVTHDRDEAFQLCDHLLLLSGGKVLTAGRTKEVFEDPGTPQAARLTGCKNISRALRIGSHRVKAVDWGGLELMTEKAVGETITHIGIRAHDFAPIGEAEAQDLLRSGKEDHNLIRVGAPEVTEMPFEWYVTLDNGIWWKKEKDIHTSDLTRVIPEWLRVEPSAVLLLEGELQIPGLPDLDISHGSCYTTPGR